ncbi:MAG: Spy/CpxP family protein refolding chaperone [Comamonas sp.]
MALLQRTLTATAAAAALVGAFALPASAQNQAAAAAPAAQTAPAHPHAARPALDPAAMHAQHMERVKPLLQLTAAQDSAWKKYVEATRPAERKAPRMDREAFSKLTTPQRIDQAQSLRKERNAAIEQRENATKAFYASLNPAQQKAFDVAMPAHGHGKGHGMHRGGPRGEGHHGMRGGRPGMGHPGQAAPAAANGA